MSDKMVDRVSKILNQAERAEEGSPEREAFMEKALALSQAHSIDLAVARAHQASKERVEVPERRQFKVGELATRQRNRNRHFADLMIGICEANDIEVVISGNAVYVWGTGMPSDLDMAERFFAILSVQMVSEADTQLKAGANGEVRTSPVMRREEIPEDERAWGEHDGSDSYGESCYYDERDEDTSSGRRYRYNVGWAKAYPPPKTRLVPVMDFDGHPKTEQKWVSLEDGRVWRNNFYHGFVNRARYRLIMAKRDAMREAGIEISDDSDSRALAIRDKRKEVRDAFEENEKFVLSSGGTYGGAEVSTPGYRGQLAGDEAGSRAKLGTEKDLGER